MKKLLIMLLFIPFISFSQNNKLYKVKLINYAIEDLKINDTVLNSVYYEVNNHFKFILLENIDELKKGEIIQIVLNCPKEKPREDKLENLDFFISIGDEKENKLNKKLGWFVFYKNKKNEYVNLWCGYIKA
jgi:hypothetical protein